MLKKILISFCTLWGLLGYTQVKIGNNVDTIDSSSILELDSQTMALVLTRINNQEMDAMSPLPGAMAYNTDTQCIHFFNGTNWQNLCENQGSGTFTFVDNQDGTFTINYSDGTSFTSSDLTGPQGPPGSDATVQQQQVVILASAGQTQFNTPSPIDDDQKIEVYRNGIRVAFTTLNANTIQLESDITCYQNDTIRIVQIL